MFKSLFGILLVLVATVAQADRIRDLTSIQGVRENSLIGYGLVVGLDGTGDQTTQTPFTTQSLNNMLSQLGITVPAGHQHAAENVAGRDGHRLLPGLFPPGADHATCGLLHGLTRKVMRGGTLLMTPLKGVAQPGLCPRAG
mgnify:CR=1 FL=1